MSSPEHIFHQPRIVFAPDDKTSGNTSAISKLDHLRQTTEDRNLLPQIDPQVVGKIGVNLDRDLSADGRRLLDCLIEERGDIDLLPIYATEDKFDLEAALDELRKYGLLDESDPKIIRIISKKL